MTSSTEEAQTEDVVRPLTQEELAIQCTHDALACVTEANRIIRAAWPSLPLGIRAALFGNTEALGEAERSIARALSAAAAGGGS